MYRTCRWLVSAALVTVSFATGCSCDDPGDLQDGGSSDAAVSDGSRPDGSLPDCGDGDLDPGELCDDGNSAGGDGCPEDCSAVHPDFVCPVPGADCVRVVTCGNGRIEGPETCDDRNATPGDGCDAGCRREDGWVCPVLGAACSAARCGDGVVAGFEICDDGGTCSGGAGAACTEDADCDDGDECVARSSDGCNDACQLEEGWACPTPGAPCETTTCGDSTVEGTEECDDGNLAIGDGCTPYCKREPRCMDGDCEAVCGDDVVFAPETCDDGNAIPGDGCSASCQVEAGYACEETPLPDPPTAALPIVIRDFIAACQDGNSAVMTRLEQGEPGAVAPYGHPDFQCYGGAETGMVEAMLVGGVPVRSSGATRLDSDASFALWYRSDPDFNRTVVQTMTLDGIGGGAYRFDSDSFFPLSTPLDGSSPSGFPTEGLEPLLEDNNSGDDEDFHFTSEVRFWFEYEGTETLAFSGDDDVWVFINRRLAVDIGGVHGREDGQIQLADCASADPGMNAGGCLAPLDLRVGGIYEAVVFQAERHTTRSQYRLTLTNFGRAPSTCESTCGDGVIASDEACDDGDANGADYDGCSSDCRLTPYCGDGIVQDDEGEICDDGLNLGGGPSSCSPGCQEMGARCGDGVVQLDEGETCDDGNAVSGDGCSDACQVELL